MQEKPTSKFPTPGQFFSPIIGFMDNVQSQREQYIVLLK